jgi:Dolichyl-phosphate-mannose-protein mannosyltransferase
LQAFSRAPGWRRDINSDLRYALSTFYRFRLPLSEMEAVIFVLSHYIATSLIVLLAYVFGRRLTLGVRYSSVLEQASFSVTLGLGLIIYIVLGLGLCGLLYPVYVVIVLFAGFLASHRVWLFWPGRLRMVFKGQNRRAILWTAALVLLFVPLLLLPLYPPTAWDSTMYHLASAKSYVQNHAMVFTPYLRYPVFPQNNQMLFTLAILLHDDIWAQLIEFTMMAALTAAVISFGLRVFSARAGVWAAAILLESPVVIVLGSIAYIDMGLMLFTTMTVYAAWNYLESRDRHWIVLAGVFTGLAMGTKYPGMFFLLVLGAIALYTVLRRRREVVPLLAIALAILVFAPWLARNFYYSGNPLFPFFSHLFGEMPGMPEESRILEAVGSYGVGQDLKALILLPWNLFVNWRSFGSRVSGLPFVVPHLLFILGIAPKKTGWLLAIGVAFTLYWFFTAQEIRYLMPAVPLLSLAAAAALDSLLDRWPLSRKWTANKVVTLLGAILLFLPGWGWSLLRIRERGTVPVTQQQRDAYLTERLPSYPAYKMLNELKGRNYTVYALHDERMAYFADGQFMGDHFGPAQYSQVMGKITDGASLYDELKRLGADYFLIRTDVAKVDLPQDEFFKSRFKPIYESGETLVFELTQE